jgi:acyl-CoA synthetase (AMP-forming)/AMP-acid ligase II
VIVGEIFERNAALFGDQTAIYFNDSTVTHAELLTRAYRLGHALLTLGLRRQDRVAILAQNCVETLELIVAAGLTGITCVGNLSRPRVVQMSLLRAHKIARYLSCLFIT